MWLILSAYNMSGTFPSTKPTPYTLTVLIVCCEDWMRFYEWSTNEVRNSRTFCPWHDLSDPPKLLVNVYCTCELLFSLVLSWLFHPLAFWISPCSPHQILALKSHFSLSFFSCLLAKVPESSQEYETSGPFCCLSVKAYRICMPAYYIRSGNSVSAV